MVHFEDKQALDRWLESKTRREWVDKLRAKIGDFDLKTMSGGFGHWFGGRPGETVAVTPGWKMALTVLVGLYPTVMLLTILIGPYTSPWGLAASMLIGNALSISILQWVVMPILTSLFGSWLTAKRTGVNVRILAAPTSLLVALAVLAMLFRQITG